MRMLRGKLDPWNSSLMPVEATGFALPVMFFLQFCIFVHLTLVAGHSMCYVN